MDAPLIRLLEEEIKSLEKQTSTRKKMLREARIDAQRNGAPGSRFVGWRPIAAIREVLEEAGRPMSQQELYEVLASNGLIAGRKRGYHNIRLSIEYNCKRGSLLCENGLISLPHVNA